jgi:hypothetical protein
MEPKNPVEMSSERFEFVRSKHHADADRAGEGTEKDSEGTEKGGEGSVGGGNG